MSRKHNRGRGGKKPDYIIYTDGGCISNPGGRGGYGVVITDTATGKTEERSKGYMATTNNRMEMMAVAEALRAVPAGKSARIFTDSQYVAKTLLEGWQRNKNGDLWAEIDRAGFGKSVEFRWIRGHNGTEGNERCDELATLAMNSSMLVPDAGYKPDAETYRTEEKPDGAGSAHRDRFSAMSVKIVIPEEVGDKGPEMMDPASYAERYGVQLKCAEAIIGFYVSGVRAFRAYANLKTYGMDSHSRKGLDSLMSDCDPGKRDAVIATVKTYLSEYGDVCAALRWKERGLTLSDSIRKVLVDVEIRRNCIPATPPDKSGGRGKLK